MALIRAGIIGVRTAHELGADGHEVTVFERRPALAAEASHANAGVIAAGCVTPWAGPGMRWKVFSQLFDRHVGVRIAGWAAAAHPLCGSTSATARAAAPSPAAQSRCWPTALPGIDLAGLGVERLRT